MIKYIFWAIYIFPCAYICIRCFADSVVCMAKTQKKIKYLASLIAYHLAVQWCMASALAWTNVILGNVQLKESLNSFRTMEIVSYAIVGLVVVIHKAFQILASNKKIKAEDWKDQFRYCLVPIIIMSLSGISIKIVEIVYKQLSDCLILLYQQEGLKNKITAFCLAYGFLLLMCAGASKTGKNLLAVEDEIKEELLKTEDKIEERIREWKDNGTQ